MFPAKFAELNGIYYKGYDKDNHPIREYCWPVPVFTILFHFALFSCMFNVHAITTTS